MDFAKGVGGGIMDFAKDRYGAAKNISFISGRATN